MGNGAAGPDATFARRALIAASIVAGLGLAVFAALELATVLLILFGSVLFAVFVRALANPIAERTGWPSGVAVAIVTVGLAVLAVAAGLLIGPPLGDQLASVVEQIPRAWRRVEIWLRSSESFATSGVVAQVQEQALRATGNMLGWLTAAATALISTLGYLAVALVVGLYLAFQPSVYRRGLIGLAPPSSRAHVRDVGRSLFRHLRGWLFGQFAAMTFVGVMTGLGLWALDFPMVVALSVIAFVLTFVPNLGPLATLLIAVVVALMQAPDKLGYVVALYLLVQILETYVVTPMVQRRTASVPPAVLLATQLLFGGLFGLMGVLLAAPLTVAVLVLVRRFYREDILGERLSPHPEPMG